jgi:hypothetical protein
MQNSCKKKECALWKKDERIKSRSKKWENSKISPKEIDAIYFQTDAVDDTYKQMFPIACSSYPNRAICLGETQR